MAEEKKRYPIMFMDQKTFKVWVQHAPGDGYLASEKTIAIEKFSEAIKAEFDEVIQPKIEQVLRMIDEWNRSSNPVLKANAEAREKAMEDQRKAQQAEKKDKAAVLPIKSQKKKKKTPKSKKSSQK